MTKKSLFNQYGIVIIDNFLDEELAQKIYELFCSCEDFQHIQQTRENHYNTILKNNVYCLPDKKEIYYASFRKSNTLSANKEFNKFLSHIKKVAKEISGYPLNYFTEPLCYEMKPGDHFRVHKDLYAGEFGYTYFLTKNWKWDWGGIVNYYLEKKDEMTPVLPRFNRLVVRNEKKELNHFVSHVTDFALESRRSINGWGSISDLTKKLETTSLGTYN